MALTEKERKKADKLHRDLVLFCMQYNPRPEHSWDEIALILFEETIDFLKSLRDRIDDFKTDSGHYLNCAMDFLSQENVHRRMVKEENSWFVLDSARLVIHAFVDEKYHGYDNITLTLWKENRELMEKHSLENHYEKPDKTCYICKYYKEKYKKK